MRAKKLSDNPSIHFPYPLNPTQWRAGAYPSCHWARGGVHPGQVASPSQGYTETTNYRDNHAHTHTPRDNLDMHVFGGRRPEYPKRTHAYTGRTSKLHTGRPQLGFKPGTLLL